MIGRTFLATVVIAALALTACTRPQTSTAAPASTLPTTGAPHATNATPSAASSQGSSSGTNAAVDHFLAVAHTAFPGEDTTTLTAEAQTICATLRHDSSVHDAVGILSSRTRDQATANAVVRAAVAAYCPDTAAR